MMHPRVPFSLWIVVAALVGSAAFGRAETSPAIDDFSGDSHVWNGLGQFLLLGRAAGFEVTSTNPLRWNQIPADAVVAIFHPRERLDTPSMIAFARGGGTVLVADDFGISSDFTLQLGLLRHEPGLVADAPRFQDRLFAPVARPLIDDHPFIREVEALVTNHPAYFRPTDEVVSIVGFSPDRVVVAQRTLGSGQLVAISDPSVFINRMLEIPGNRRFATNLLTALRAQSSSASFVLAHDRFYSSGVPPIDAPAGPRRLATATAEALNRALDSAAEYVMTDRARFGVPGLFSVLLVTLALLGLRERSPSSIHERWAPLLGRPRFAAELTEALRTVERHRSGDDHARVVAWLAHAIDRRAARALDAPDAGSWNRQQLSERLAHEFGSRAAQHFRELHRQIDRLLSDRRRGRVTRRQLARLALREQRLSVLLAQNPTHAIDSTPGSGLSFPR